MTKNKLGENGMKLTKVSECQIKNSRFVNQFENRRYGVQTNTVERINYQNDPRADLNGDHEAWVRLLHFAKQSRDSEVWGVLHALRCGGALIRRDARFGYRILRGEWTESGYREFRDKYMASRGQEIQRLLKQAATTAVIVNHLASTEERPTEKVRRPPIIQRTQSQLFATSKKEAV